MKRACNGFQVSAGVFSDVRRLVLEGGSAAQFSTVDLSSDCLDMVVALLLAQGQACVYEKAVGSRKSGGGVKASVLGKIAASAAGFYEESYKKCKAGKVGQSLDQSWGANLQSQRLLFLAATMYWESVNQRDIAGNTGSGYGLEIAGLVGAEDFCEQAVVFNKKTGGDGSAVKGLLDLILQRKSEAIDDNKKVYMEAVPNINQLPPVKPATLVKCLPLNAALTTLPNPPLFGGMLPKAGRDERARFEERVGESLTEWRKKVSVQERAVLPLPLPLPPPLFAPPPLSFTHVLLGLRRQRRGSRGFEEDRAATESGGVFGGLGAAEQCLGGGGFGEAAGLGEGVG